MFFLKKENKKNLLNFKNVFGLNIFSKFHMFIEKRINYFKNENNDNKKKENLKELKKEIKCVKKNNKAHLGEKNSPNTDDNIIELFDVKKSFFNGSVINEIIKGISLKIPKGKFVVILGKSGSGKTTLMNIMSGLIRASEGKVVVNNTNLINLKTEELTNFRRKNIGYIFQEYGLLESLTVFENVKTGFILNKNNIDNKEIKNKDKKIWNNKNNSIINDILKSVNMFDHKKKFPSELSGGQQQRVAICRAIAKNPEIIFGDEPTGALDTHMSGIILNILKKINKEKGTTIILITHDENIAKIADIVYIIKNGLIENCQYNENLDISFTAQKGN